MTVHYRESGHYDEGGIIAQFTTNYSLHADDSPEEIAAKVLKVEHEHFIAPIRSTGLFGRNLMGQELQESDS